MIVLISLIILLTLITIITERYENLTIDEYIEIKRLEKEAKYRYLDEQRELNTLLTKIKLFQLFVI